MWNIVFSLLIWHHSVWKRKVKWNRRNHIYILYFEVGIQSMLKCLAKNSNSLVQNCQTLQVLNLSCCEGLNLQLIQQIVDNCVELTEVTFDKISMIQNFDRSLASGNNILPEGYRIVYPLISYPDWIWNEFLIPALLFWSLKHKNIFRLSS